MGLLRVAEARPGLTGTTEHPGNVQQLARVERATEGGPLQGGLHRTQPGEVGRAAHVEQGTGRAGLRLKAADLLQVGLRPEGAGPLLRGQAGRLRGQQLEHLRQLERADGFFKAFCH